MTTTVVTAPLPFVEVSRVFFCTAQDRTAIYGLRAPNRAVPTRISVAPSAIATS